jgi:hypothetical protein
MIDVVLDTNVLVAAMRSEFGASFRVLELALQGAEDDFVDRFGAKITNVAYSLGSEYIGGVKFDIPRPTRLVRPEEIERSRYSTFERSILDPYRREITKARQNLTRALETAGVEVDKKELKSRFDALVPQFKKIFTKIGVQKTMEFINELTGGDKYKKGYIDWNPSAIEYLGEYLGGGRLKFYNRLLKTTSQLWDDSVEPELKDYPIINRFIGKKKEYDYSKDYNETNAKILSEQGTFVDYQKDPEYKDKANEVKSNNRVMMMKKKRGEPLRFKLVAYDQMLKTEKKIKELYKSITPDNEKEVLKIINDIKKEYILDYKKIYKTKQ